MTSETHACHNLQPTSGMSTGHSNNTFKQVCRHVLKLQQNILNYVFLLFCVHWHWKLSLTFHPDTANLKNVQMAAIFTSLGHKILKLHMVRHKKKVYRNTIFIFFKTFAMMMVHSLKICTAISSKTQKIIPKYMLNKIRKKLFQLTLLSLGMYSCEREV